MFIIGFLETFPQNIWSFLRHSFSNWMIFVSDSQKTDYQISYFFNDAYFCMRSMSRTAVGDKS